MSFAVLAALAGVAAGVGVAQGRYDPGPFRALAAAAAAKDAPRGGSGTTAAAPADLFGVAPDDRLRAVAPLERYTADDLHLKIDGKADLYLSAGFVELRCGRFGAPDGGSGGGGDGLVEACVYDMGAPDNAWSVWSRQRRDGARDVDLTPAAYATDDGLFLATGRLYAEIVARSPAVLAVRDDLGARLVAANRPATTEEGPPGSALLPPDGLDRDGLKLVTESAFGFARFDRVLIARYGEGEDALSAFVSLRADAAEAAALRDAYVAFLLANGGRDLGAAEDVRYVDLYGTVEALFTAGAVLAGVHEAPSREAAAALAGHLRARIAEVRP